MSLRAAEPAKTGPDVVEEPQQSVEDRGLEGRILKQLRKRRRARGYTDNEFNYVDRRTREERERQAEARAAERERRRKQQAAVGGPPVAESSSESEGGGDASAFKSEADLFDETLSNLPWPYLRTRLDRVNAFSPVHLFRYYFVRHSTGPSYAYLLAALMVLGAYIAMVISRYIDVGEQNTEWFRVGVREEAGLQLAEPVPDLLSPLTGFRYRFAGVNASTRNDADPLDVDAVDYSWQQCTRTESTRDSTAGRLVSGWTDSCTDVGVTERDINGEPYVAAAAEMALDGALSDARKESTTFVRFRLRRCTSCNLTLAEVNSAVDGGRLEFAGLSHGETQVRDIDDGVLNPTLRSASFSLVPGMRQLSQMVYRRVTIVDHARFVVDGDEDHLATYVGPREGFVPDGNAAGGILFEIDFVLDGERTQVQKLTVGWIDLIAQIAALLVVLTALGLAPYLFNRWHFRRFGQFEAADLPKKYVDRLLDPKVKEPVVGRRHVKAVRRDNKFSENEFTLRQCMRKLTGVRETLRPLIEKALADEMEKQERA